jgi:hypothetical protein
MIATDYTEPAPVDEPAPGQPTPTNPDGDDEEQEGQS